MHEPLKESSEFVDSLYTHDPLKEFRESVKAFQVHDPMRELRESIKALQIRDPLKELRDSIEALRMHDPLREIRESMKALQLHDPLKEMRESIKAYQSFTSIADLIKALSDNRWSLMLEGDSDIEINADGLISIDSHLVTREQVQEIAQTVVRNALSGTTYPFEQSLDRLINEIRSMKDPVFQRLLAWLIYPLIVGLVLSVVNPATDFYIKEALTSGEKRQVVKEVSKALTSTINEKSYLKSFRIVTATSLNVRTSSSNTSDIIGQLYLGDVVEIIEKGRSWSLISWQDNESDALIRGWVLSRYLKAIK